MSLFQHSVLNKYFQELDKLQVETAYNKFIANFGNPEKQNNIREAKEEQYQEGFLNDLFVNVLEYTKNPEPNFNITTEYKNEKDAKKADGAILKETKPIAIIELKGTDTIDLDTVEQQAFNYKNNQSNCKYIITSNFEKLRFYIENAIDYEEFELFNLSKERFALLFLCLSKDHLLSDLPLKIKQASLTQEENITKKLYSDYSTFKHLIFLNIVELNPQYDKLLLYKKTQKLLDRFLFIFFAEDRLLLPPNSLREIIKQWEQLKDLDNYMPLYDRFKKYFTYLNIGHKGKEHDIFAYNGGLFEPDEILDNIKIDDQILFTHTHKLSDYDFETEIDVNILGHIFEHSLNEIEEVQAELEGQTIDKNKTKRKKDGIFYTPKYITKYIVDNTLGALCDEKKKELGINEDEFSYTKRKDKRKELLEKLDTYRNWLLKLTICDPACGSGAFLNQALNYLINEHKLNDELQAKVSGASIVFPDIESKILENNLYGVDLNDESIEIAKLSLWLRTAQKGRKLTSLNNNIKCGNSLIDDTAIAGDKAFNWQNEFPDVFANGGFDVVIGNPPYVRQELFKEIKPYLEKHYKCYNSIADLYTYFIEKGIELMNIKGKFSFILPNKFLKASYGNEIRKVIIDNVQIDLIFDFDDYPVFEEATTYPLIYVFSKEINKNKTTFIYSEINKRYDTTDPIGKLINLQINVSYDSIKKDNWQFLDSNNDNLINKIKSDSICLKEVVEDKIFRGVSTGKNEVFIIDKQTATKLINERNKNLIRKIVTGKEVKRYNIKFDNLYLLYITWEYDLEFDEGIKKYLLENKDLLENRPEVKEGRFNWWCLSRYGSKNSEYLFKPKIIYPRINNECNFFFDTNGEFSLSDNNFFISTDEKYLLPILNSKVVFYFLKSIASTLQGGYLDFRRPYIETIPIKIPEIKTPFIEKSDLMLSKNKELQELKTKFIKLLLSKYNDLKISNKLENWTELDFKAFSKELEKQKIKLTLSEQSEWIEYFEKEKAKAQEIKSVIDKTDKEIDRMVYQLYELTDEEIKIIENQ